MAQIIISAIISSAISFVILRHEDIADWIRRKRDIIKKVFLKK